MCSVRDSQRGWYKFSNSTTSDLWTALEEASGKPLQDMMASWTQHMGFPALEVHRSAAGDAWEVSQSRSLLTGSGKDSDKEEVDAKKQRGHLWKVPLSMLHDGSSEPVRILLSEGQNALPLRGKWTKLNAGIRTPLRVHNSPELLDSLAAAASGTADSYLWTELDCSTMS